MQAYQPQPGLYPPGIGIGMGMGIGVGMHPGMIGPEPYGYMGGYPNIDPLGGLHPMAMEMGMVMSGLHPSMLGMRPRRNPYYDMYGYGGGRGGGRYLEPYDMFDGGIFGDDWYLDCDDNIDDPMIAFDRMRRRRRGGRRRRYGRYGGDMGFDGYL